ncbi:MAG: phosphoribosylformylglycinamidine synthase I [Candidatus Omnitrophota bacterium]
MARPKVCVLRTAGTNCDQETAFAFNQAGAQAELVHINMLAGGKRKLKNYQVLAIPGGFTYGDDVSAGKILANELRYKLQSEVCTFLREGKLIIGICNGFQVLVKSGLLPGNGSLSQEASLVINDSGKFEDRWVYLKLSGRCAWTNGLPERIYLPVAHGEGKFITRDDAVLGRLEKKGQVVFRYCDKEGNPTGYPDNPNGSEDNISGICDESGRVFGLMPHPERYITFSQGPRKNAGRRSGLGDGFLVFKSGVDYVRRYL